MKNSSITDQGTLGCKECNNNSVIAIRDTNDIIYPICLECTWNRDLDNPKEMIDFGMEFRKKFTKKGIHSLYTLIPKDSLDVVIKYGILSRQRANSVANYTSQGIDFLYDSESVMNFEKSNIVPVSLNRYVRTHFNPNNMFIRNMKNTYEDQFILMEIDMGVLDQIGTLFTTRSLKHHNVNIFMDMNDLSSSLINWIVIQNITPVIQTWEDENKIKDMEFQEAAEVLIYSHIPSLYISKIIVDKEPEIKIYENMLKLLDEDTDIKIEMI